MCVFAGTSDGEAHCMRFRVHGAAEFSVHGLSKFDISAGAHTRFASRVRIGTIVGFPSLCVAW